MHMPTCADPSSLLPPKESTPACHPAVRTRATFHPPRQNQTTPLTHYQPVYCSSQISTTASHVQHCSKRAHSSSSASRDDTELVQPHTKRSAVQILRLLHSPTSRSSQPIEDWPPFQQEPASVFSTGTSTHLSSNLTLPSSSSSQKVFTLYPDLFLSNPDPLFDIPPAARTSAEVG